MSVDRRAFLEACAALGLSGTLFPGVLYAQVDAASKPPLHTAESDTPAAVDVTITTQMIADAAAIAGLEFTEEEREMMVEDLTENLERYQALRELSTPNSLRPAVVFDPRLGGAIIPDTDSALMWSPPEVERPSSDEDLAFMSVAELAGLLKTQQVTSMELTELYLSRLKQYNPVLEAVITYTEDRARQAARRADEEIGAGNWRGPLHGMPYGAKDLLAVEGYPTTWGAVPYQEQVIDETATVIQKLDEAGAVLVAKLTLGALAWGDVWYGGTTKNPWNVEQGASGSSAGPGSAVAAGCVPFAIGSETLGSIVSPSTRNGITGHRPSFGAVSRHGAMTLSWTMDKLGPMARSAEDCALVFDVLRGKDPKDPSTVDMPFRYDADLDVSTLRIGYYAEAFESDYDNRDADQQTLETLRGLSLDLQAVSLPNDMPVGAMLNTLDVEAAAAFDELTRTRGIDEMVRQTKDAWPHVFRTARLIPAVEFVQMNRARVTLMERTHQALDGIDVFVSPSYQGSVLGITNLTGHPCVCVPNAFRPLEDAPDSPRRQPASVSFIGALYRDDAALALARAYQNASDFHTRRPPIQ